MINLLNKNYYTREEAAEKLGLSAATLAKLRKSGELNPLFVGRKKVYYEETELVRYLHGANEH